MSSDFNSQNEDQNNNHDPENDHHDHGRFNMSVLGNPNNLPTITEGDYTLSPFFTGPVTITNLSGAGFTVYGDYQDINFLLTGNTYSTSGTFNDLINHVSITLGGNHITLGSGVNTIYGTIRDLNMTDTGGTALGLGTTGVTVNTLIENTNIDLTGGGLGNTITAGNGVNTVYGDMRDYTLTAGSATAISDPTFNSSPNTVAFTEILNLNFTVGGNHINLGNGVNTVYGDMRSINFVAPGSTTIGYNSVAASGPGDTFDFNYSFHFGVPLPSQLNHFNFNGNTITVGNGVNVVYGHLQTVTFSVTGAFSSSPGSLPTLPSGPGWFASTLPSYTASTGNVVAGASEQSQVANEILTMGMSNITAGVGVNTIFGDFQNFQSKSVGGTINGVPTGVPLVSTDILPYQIDSEDVNTISLAGNIITAGLMGSSVNTIYGNTQDFNFNSSFQGKDIQGSDHGSPVGALDTFNMGGNQITTGNGVNTIYGSMRDYTALSTGGVFDGANLSTNVTSTFGHPIQDSFTSTDTLTMLGNNISVGSGINLIYGDMRDLTFIAIGGTGINQVDNSFDTNVEHQDIYTISFGPNVITALSGVNTVYGDMRDLTFSDIGGQSQNVSIGSGYLDQSFIASNFITMGLNTITVGSGVNTIDGNFRDLTYSVTGGNNDSVPSLTAFATSNAANTVIMGNGSTMDNTITAGVTGSSSVNVISGNGEDVVFSAVGGTATGGLAAVNAIAFDSIIMGDNHITINGGGTSTIYGNVQTMSWSAVGGQADGLGSYAEAQLNNNFVQMGGNVITDNGNGSDTIYGDAQTISLSVQGGAATHVGPLTYFNSGTGMSVTTPTDAAAYMTNNLITLGGNTIHGGTGNDVIYASLQNLSFSAHAGSGTGAGAYFSGQINYADGGLVNVGTPSNPFIVPTATPDSGNIITFHNDTVVGGSGNDTIIGSDALNLSGLSAFLAANPLPGNGPNVNEILWGDNTLTGGTGADKFEFSLASLHANDTHLENQGHATITDFNTGQGDKLVFKVAAGVTLAQINADTVFDTSHNVGGGAANDTVATFHDGSSITLYDVNIAAFSAANTVLVH